MQENELILIDKPAGITSFGVVARVRRVLSEQANSTTAEASVSSTQLGAQSIPAQSAERRGLSDKTRDDELEARRRNGWSDERPARTKRRRIKVGHAGTLDPFATGLLTILTGKMTKRAGELTKLDKTYEATIILGATSTTGDPEGEITHTSDRQPTLTEIQQTLTHFTGDQLQKPPIFSAIKINGQRAYHLARKGKQPEIPPRPITIHSITLDSYSYPELRITTHVSSGTYIRSLATDVGDHLDTGAYLSQLRRTRVGPHSIIDAKTLPELGITD